MQCFEKWCEGDIKDYVILSKRLLEICDTENLSDFIKNQQNKYAAHIVRSKNTTVNKQLLFNSNKNSSDYVKVPPHKYAGQTKNLYTKA